MKVQPKIKKSHTKTNSSLRKKGHSGTKKIEEKKGKMSACKNKKGDCSSL